MKQLRRFSRTLCAYCCESFERRYKTEGFCCLEHRLLAHTFVPYGKEKHERCWIWRRARNGDGYGLIRVDGVQRYAHVVSYEIHHGPVPEGQEVRHTCHNPSCVNPAHLVAGTHQDNIDDRNAAGRTAKGERNGRAILTEGQAAEVRERYAVGGVTQEKLGQEFGVDRSTIGRVVRGDTW